MSLIYNDCKIYCSNTPFDPNIINTNLAFPLSQLYFCPICQEPRANYQTTFEIESGFCNNCLTDYSQNKNLLHCIKNCFGCPECKANLSISMTDHDKNGKSFNFNCVYCEYKYTTSIIYKPKPLHAIIEDEKRTNPDSFHQLCEAIMKGVLGPQEDRKLDKNIELMLKSSHLSKQEIFQPSELDLSTKLYPQPRKLNTKTTHRCSHCNNLVLAYTNDKTSPITNKYAVKFNAIDYLPNISISNIFNQSKLNTHELKKWNNNTVIMIHFMNPMNVKCSINISITSSFKVTRDITCKTTIPLNQFTLGPTSTNLIKTIPSCFLTTSSKGKNELILRKGDVLYNPPATFEEVEENLDSFVERGLSWYSIPVIINLIGNSDTFNLKLPIYINMKSELPDILKKIPGHDTLSIGYWSVIDLGSISLV